MLSNCGPLSATITSWSLANTYYASVSFKHLRYGPLNDRLQRSSLVSLFAFFKQVSCPEVHLDLVHPPNACFTSIAYSVVTIDDAACKQTSNNIASFIGRVAAIPTKASTCTFFVREILLIAHLLNMSKVAYTFERYHAMRWSLALYSP